MAAFQPMTVQPIKSNNATGYMGLYIKQKGNTTRVVARLRDDENSLHQIFSEHLVQENKQVCLYPQRSIHCH